MRMDRKGNSRRRWEFLVFALAFFIIQIYLNIKLFNSGVLKAYQRLNSPTKLYLETLLAESLGEVRFTVAAQLWLLADIYLHKGEEKGRDLLHSPDITYLMRFITFIDPHFVKAYDVGGYQLGIGLGKHEEAIKFLKEGIENNPDAFILYFDIGVIYVRVLKDCDNGLKWLEKAREKLLAHPPEDPWYFQFVMKSIYTFETRCYFDKGDYERALRTAEKIRDVWPYGGEDIYLLWKRRIQEAMRKVKGEGEKVPNEGSEVRSAPSGEGNSREQGEG